MEYLPYAANALVSTAAKDLYSQPMLQVSPTSTELFLMP